MVLVIFKLQHRTICSCSNYLKYMENFDYRSILVDTGALCSGAMLKTTIIIILSKILITMIPSCAETVEQCPTAGELLVPGGKASRANLEPCPSGCFWIRIQQNLLLFFSYLNSLLFSLLFNRMLPFCWLVLLRGGDGVRPVCHGSCGLPLRLDKYM